MMKTLICTVAAMTLFAGPCIADHHADMNNAKAYAQILGQDGAVIGEAVFTQGTIGVLANVTIEKGSLPVGAHGFHIHKHGSCEHNDGFKSASGHINPDEKAHGYLNEGGPDQGDLPNLIVHEDGSAAVELFIPQLDVNSDKLSLLDEDGSALMIHENADDHLTQPIGGAGARIGCGVIQSNKENANDKGSEK